MAVLSDGERAAIWTEFQRTLSAAYEAVGLTKAEGREAINAVDQWIDANAASFNAALPQPARTVLTAKQKQRLFLFVARRRFEV